MRTEAKPLYYNIIMVVFHYVHITLSFPLSLYEPNIFSNAELRVGERIIGTIVKVSWMLPGILSPAPNYASVGLQVKFEHTSTYHVMFKGTEAPGPHMRKLHAETCVQRGRQHTHTHTL